MQRSLLTSCLLLCFFAFSHSPKAEEKTEESGLRVVTHLLQQTPLVTELELSGTLQAYHHSNLSVAVGALVKAIHADAGTKVKRGDLLLELDNSIAAQEHQRALAQLAAAEATATEAIRLRDEALRLTQQNHIAQTEVGARESAAKLANAGLKQAQAEARIAAETLAKHRLTAPFDGVISARTTDLGQWLNPGDPVFTLVSQELLRLDVKLPQEHMSHIDAVKSVSIRPDTQPSLSIPAKVDALVPVGDESRTVLLRIVANQPSSALFPGASARAHLRFEHQQSAVLLPRDAVLRNADGNYSVFVVENNKAYRRKIALGVNSQNGYLIEEGLRAGEQVVIRGNEILEDGQAVQVVDASSQTEQSTSQASNKGH